MEPNIKLRVSQIEKSFPGVKALNKIDFSVRKGTVHALCGENGAGKSTLMKIINGIYKPDTGQIFIDEKPVKILNPIHARSYGIAMIAQELNYVPEMSIEENLFLGRLPVTKYGKVDWKLLRKKTIEFLSAEGLPYKPDQKLKTLTVSDIQMLEIIKAINNKAEIIVMDEPTSAITQREVDILFKKIEVLKSQGVSIVYISHKLDEVFQIADDITIFRDGTVVESHRASDLDMDKVIALMVGRKIENVYPKEEIKLGDKLLEIKDLCSTGVFKNINFHVSKGEIIGFAGLVGAGRTEVMRAIFGLDPITSGHIMKDGQKVEIKSVKDSIKNKMVMLTEDRRRYGIIPIRSVMENASISILEKIIYGGYAHEREERKIVGEYFSKMNVKTPSLETPIQSLSGGNQQKVLLAKWMLRNPDILILDEPTRGIDVGAKFEIYKLMSEMAKQNRAVIMVSSELPELIGMCDRIYVMNQGKITGELQKSEFCQESIMKYATSTI
ncbi:monosaccharide ABC transporter ATP-binding protein (CUT2 family) [Mobilisporobacter senegalensis]|uniref:Monosaccharide ABC transporter ATP-binding protein (CUT2 family) n=1 Tax=Mobilisporobacter senegalensis TaxID=1329262 RepID=A0A3N1XRJ9_9FIRM|nr:sugar ABC transporter ATP-binding protein [Mobilisporobacter senegalensis]ROR29293.1 monosaccharide ABC transporter ATP-binding protein (CUT2 family) [Mobilisporobacter senegalensis]